jgi:hypothetical protein
MLRVLFVFLLLLNTLVLAWNFNLLAPVGLPANHGREPERLDQQIRPELLQVRPLGASSQSASQADFRPVDASAAQAASQP